MPYIDRCNWINQDGVQCAKPLGHKDPHGKGLLTGPQEAWHEFIEERPVRRKLEQRFGRVWTIRSANGRCLWRGMFGLCIYEAGHTIAHREGTADHDPKVRPTDHLNSTSSSALREPSIRPETAP